MDQQSYISAVLSCLQSLTDREQESVRAELAGHIEDRMEALIDLGYEAPLAEQRALSAMGDAEEVGRAINRQYPLRWLIVKDVATGFLTLFLMLALVFGGQNSDFWKGLVVRFDPVRMSGWDACGWTIQTDARLKAGNDTVKAYQVSVMESPTGPVATIYLCAYDRIPGGIVSGTLQNGLTIEDQRGNTVEAADTITKARRNYYSAEYFTASIPVEAGDTHVILHYDQYGRQAQCTISLPEVAP